MNWPEQHHAGVVDQHVGAAELVLDALGRGDERVAVGDVRGDRDRAAAELVGESLDAVGAAGEQRDAVSVSSQRASGGRADARRGAGDKPQRGRCGIHYSSISPSTCGTGDFKRTFHLGVPPAASTKPATRR